MAALSRRILWDVDTQVDFMLPHGKLYVPGAEETAPAMKRLVDAARAAGIPHVASADDHELTDPEIAHDPDFTNTFPPHCLRGTHGAEKIPETQQEDPLPLALIPYPPGLVPALIEGHRETWLLRSIRFRSWLRRRHYNATGGPHPQRRSGRLSMRSKPRLSSMRPGALLRPCCVWQELQSLAWIVVLPSAAL